MAITQSQSAVSMSMTLSNCQSQFKARPQKHKSNTASKLPNSHRGEGPTRDRPTQRAPDTQRERPTQGARPTQETHRHAPTARRRWTLYVANKAASETGGEAPTRDRPTQRAPTQRAPDAQRERPTQGARPTQETHRHAPTARRRWTLCVANKAASKSRRVGAPNTQRERSTQGARPTQETHKH